MDIDVRAVDPYDDDVMAARTGILTRARAHDIPDLPPVCPVRAAGRLRHHSRTYEVTGWLGYLDGQPAGVLTCWLPQAENVGNMQIELVVDPAHRRLGTGRALYDVAVAYARDRDRVRLTADTVTTLPDGPARDESGNAFAEAMGAKPALYDVRRRLDLSTVDIGALEPVRAPGYSVVHWRDRAPGEYLDDLARMDGRFLLDAPSGDLVLEPFRTDAARIRDEEESAVRRRERTYHTGIRHDVSGAMVAWTTLCFNATVPDHAWQHVTIVDPEHRGRRLGLRVKVENVRWTIEREPALRTVDTWNAAENTHMIAINDAIGYRPVDAARAWQHELSR